MTINKRRKTIFALIHVIILPPIYFVLLFTLAIFIEIRSEVFSPSISKNTVVSYTFSEEDLGFLSINVYTDVYRSYGEVSSWYKEKGYWCDGSCEETIRIHLIGDYYLYGWKIMKPKDNEFKRYPLQLFLHIELSIKKDEKD